MTTQIKPMNLHPIATLHEVHADEEKTVLSEREEDVDTSELDDGLLDDEDDEDATDVTGQIFEDHFVVETKYFDHALIKNIGLPKFIMGQGSVSYKEKSFVLITFYGDHKSGSYKKILQSMGDNLGKFKIKFLDEDKEVVSVWEFLNPRVHAIDFGHVAKSRPAPAEFAIEIDYTGMKIDGVQI